MQNQALAHAFCLDEKHIHLPQGPLRPPAEQQTILELHALPGCCQLNPSFHMSLQSHMPDPCPAPTSNHRQPRSSMLLVALLALCQDLLPQSIQQLGYGF